MSSAPIANTKAAGMEAADLCGSTIGQKLRKKEKSKFFKRTKKGQPVMKHRVDKILSQLQH